MKHVMHHPCKGVRIPKRQRCPETIGLLMAILALIILAFLLDYLISQ